MKTRTNIGSVTCTDNSGEKQKEENVMFIATKVAKLGLALKIWTVALGASIALAGDGAGTSGPDSGGVAIPTKLDRVYDLQQVVNAVDTCSVDLLKSVFAQVTTIDPKDMVVAKSFYDDNNDAFSRRLTLADPDIDFNLFTLSGPTLRLDAKCPNTRTPMEIKFDEYFADFASLLAQSRGVTPCFRTSAKILSEVRLAIKSHHDDFGLPYVVFNKEKDTPIYGDLGEVLDRQILVKNVAIRMNKQGLTQKLNLSGAGGPTKVTINTQEYFNCLVTELQK